MCTAAAGGAAACDALSAGIRGRRRAARCERIFANYVHSVDGNAGWPMYVLLTPEFHPFIGGSVEVHDGLSGGLRPALAAGGGENESCSRPFHVDDTEEEEAEEEDVRDTGDEPALSSGPTSKLPGGTDLSRLLEDVAMSWQDLEAEIRQDATQGFVDIVNAMQHPRPLASSSSQTKHARDGRSDTEYDDVDEDDDDIDDISSTDTGREDSDFAEVRGERGSEKEEERKGTRIGAFDGTDVATTGVRRRRTSACELKCYRLLDHEYDAYCGGFGDAPRPCPSVALRFLIEIDYIFVHSTRGAYLRSINKLDPRLMISSSVNASVDGGLHDHIGGGYFEYCSDALYHVPDCEKTLSTNAQFASALTAAWTRYGEEVYSDSAKSALDYMHGTLLSNEGGLFAGETASGVPRYESHRRADGGDVSSRGSSSSADNTVDSDDSESISNRAADVRYYAWSAHEVRTVLREADFSETSVSEFCQRYTIEDAGNCTAAASECSNAHRWFVGLNIPRRSVCDVEAEETREKRDTFAAARRALHMHRQRISRTRPAVDTKLFAGWNGLALSAFAKAGMLLPPSDTNFPLSGCEPACYLEVAGGIARFLRERMWDSKTRALVHCLPAAATDESGDSEGGGDRQFASDYANVIAGFLDLFETTGCIDWLDTALDMHDAMESRFWDADEGGFFETTGDDFLLPRSKVAQDNREASATSTGAMNMLRLSTLLGGTAATTAETTKTTTNPRAAELRARSEACVRSFEWLLSRKMASAMPALCSVAGALWSPMPMTRVVVIGTIGSPAMTTMLRAAHSFPMPFTTIVPIDAHDETSLARWRRLNADLAALAEDLRDRGDAVAFIRRAQFRAPPEEPPYIDHIILDPEHLFSFELQKQS